MKEMNDVYTVQIDSINKVNAQLLAANDSLNTNLSQERSKNNSLLSENDRLFSKVSAGSVLKAMNVKTEGFRFKSNGDEVLTNKAKQVQNSEQNLFSQKIELSTTAQLIFMLEF